MLTSFRFFPVDALRLMPRLLAVLTFLPSMFFGAEAFDASQAASATAKTPARARTDPPFSSAAAVYARFSGPGEPVQGAGLGGWRSGREGVRYRGPHPKPGWQLDWDEKKTSSDQVIELGLLPPIKPLLELHLRDTIIRRGGDGCYYLTGSTGDNIWDLNGGVELWKSSDLKKWEYRGVIWDIDRDGTWQKRCRYMWAPEIHYVRGNYYVTYCMSGGPNGGTGILKSTSGKPEGPYVSATAIDAPLTPGIDATLFEDDDGAVYFTWGRGAKIYRLKDDLSGFADEGRDVEVDAASLAKAKEVGKGQSAAFEGASLFKRNGKYYLGGAIFVGGIDRATGRNGRYSSALMISESLYGPYRQWHEAVPCGGGGNYFQANDGTWYCTYFGNDEASPFREKPALVKIDFAADDTVVVAEDQPAFVLRDGARTRWRAARTSSLVAALPVGAAESRVRVLIVDGCSNHDWKLTTALIRGILAPTGLFTVDVSTAPASADAPGWSAWRPKFRDYDVVIQNYNDLKGGAPWPAEVRSAFEAYVAGGGGVYIWHSANNAFVDWPAYNEMIGLGWRKKDFGAALTIDDQERIVRIPASQGPDTGHGARVDTVVKRLGDHPIHAGLPRQWKTPDIEIYYYARGPARNLDVLSYGYDPKTRMNWPLEWVVRYGKGRVYTSTFGHVWAGDRQPERMRCAGVQTVAIRALQWLAGRPVTWPVPPDFPLPDAISIRPEITLAVGEKL